MLYNHSELVHVAQGQKHTDIEDAYAIGDTFIPLKVLGGEEHEPFLDLFHGHPPKLLPRYRIEAAARFVQEHGLRV